ncbi:MAG: Fic/DOC family protein [Pseudonocardia sp.]
MSWDPYLDLDSGVLRNRLGITDPAELAQAEAELTALRLAELIGSPLPGRYDLTHLRAFHQALFGDLYSWAGELRTVSLGRAGHLFPFPEDVARVATALFGVLAARDHLHGLPREDFLDGLTGLLADLNALHPFREGNGRTQRAFVAQLARDAGHTLRWAGLTRAENTAASRAAFEGDLKPLHTLLDRLLVR